MNPFAFTRPGFPPVYFLDVVVSSVRLRSGVNKPIIPSVLPCHPVVLAAHKNDKRALMMAMMIKSVDGAVKAHTEAQRASPYNCIWLLLSYRAQARFRKGGLLRCKVWNDSLELLGLGQIYRRYFLGSVARPVIFLRSKRPKAIFGSRVDLEAVECT